MDGGNEEEKKESKPKEETQVEIFDRVFKRILTLSNRAVVNFINGLFGEDFPPDSKLVYNWTESVKNDLEKTIADTIITVNGAKRYHIEVEIESGGSIIVLRVFDYAYQDALKYRVAGSDRIILEFPKSKVIFLNHTKNTPDEVILELRFGEGESYEYKIPTMKFLEHSIEALDRQKMVILLPLYLLKLRREIEKEQSRKTALELKTLINEKIIGTIEANEEAGQITHDDTVVLIGLLRQLYAYLYGTIAEMSGGVTPSLNLLLFKSATTCLPQTYP